MKNSHKQHRPQTKIVLSGSPGVGKTSILHHLQELKYETRVEVFTRLFAEAQKEGRFNEEFLRSPQIVHELASAQEALESQPSNSSLLSRD